MRAWLALRQQGIEFEERMIDLRRPQRFRQLAKVGEISPPGAVPVLVTETATIFDSLAIMEFASEQGATSLLPDGVHLRSRARSFVAWQHAGLSGLCPRLSFESSFYPDRRSLTAEESRDCKRLFVAIESELVAHGGPFLFKNLSLADLALTPTVIRLDAHKPDFSGWPLTEKWFQTVLELEHVQQWLDQARALDPIWLDDYLPN